MVTDPSDLIDPERSIASYGSIYTGFMTSALAQSRLKWHPAFTAEAVNACIRAGFSTMLFADGFEAHTASP